MVTSLYAVTYSLYLVLSPLYAVLIQFYAVGFLLYLVHVDYVGGAFSVICCVYCILRCNVFIT